MICRRNKKNRKVKIKLNNLVKKLCLTVSAFEINLFRKRTKDQTLQFQFFTNGSPPDKLFFEREYISQPKGNLFIFLSFLFLNYFNIKLIITSAKLRYKCNKTDDKIDH